MARKGENIYKRKDGRWEGRYIKSRSSTGKANYGYVYAKSYREVKAKLISQSSCTSNSVTVDPEISSDQFEQVAMEWFQAICPKVKESTSNKYRNLLSSYILPVFGSKQLRDITHEFKDIGQNSRSGIPVHTHPYQRSPTSRITFFVHQPMHG